MIKGLTEEEILKVGTMEDTGYECAMSHADLLLDGITPNNSHMKRVGKNG